ncbi:serine/threonine-protein kinase [Streptomyces sp. NPDC021224]|uniref:serine/threonine-protein kinase n=1 Tax=unclassified Streptomyces TaxID=2593676 RepID=UPI0037931FFE
MAQETQPGTVVGGRFRLDEALARGGFGIVWRARDLHLGLDVAVKELYLPPATSPKEHADRLARAEREPRNAARLRDHPNIVAVHDVVFDDDKPWMIMRLVSGHSLLEHLAEHGPLSEAEATRAARNLLAALLAAHREEVVHRDVKPANVMVAENGDYLLTDFGIAIHASDTSLTTTGGFVGSLEYVAPERANGIDDRPVSDLFSLGATLYQAVEGVSPFRRDSQTATLTAVLIEQPEPPRRAGALEPLITALLEKDPDARPTAEQALALLDAPPKAAGGTARTKVMAGGSGASGTSGGGAGPSSGPGSSSGPGPSRQKAADRSGIWVGLALLVVLALVFGPKLVDAAKKDHASGDDTPSTSSSTTYDPLVGDVSGGSDPATDDPATDDPAGEDTDTEEPDPTPDPACHTAIDTLQAHLDLIPNPVTDDNVDSAVATYDDLATHLDGTASDADDPDVETAISALAADATTMGASLRDSGNGSFDAAKNEMTSDMDDLSTACKDSAS